MGHAGKWYFTVCVISEYSFQPASPSTLKNLPSFQTTAYKNGRHGRRLCSNWFRHGSTTISYPQCSLTFMRERYLHRCQEQSFAIRAYAMSAVGIDVVSVHKLFAYRVVSTVSTDIVCSHTKYCRIAYGITR